MMKFNKKKTIAIAAAAMMIMIAAKCASQAAPAKPAPAASTSAPKTASSTVIAPAVEKENPLPAPDELAMKSKNIYSKINSYTVRFDLIQNKTPGNKPLAADKKEDLRNEYRLAYIGKGSEDTHFLMRLTAVRGQNQKTVVVHGPDKKGVFKYFVYKPAGRVVLGSNDPRTSDLPKTGPNSFVDEIAIAAANPDNKKRLEYIKAINSYVLMIESKEGRTTSYFDKDTLYLTRQDFEIRKKNKFLFKQSIAWSDFVPNAKITAAEITAAPNKH